MRVGDREGLSAVGSRLLLRVDEAARLCDVSRSYMYELIARGEIPSVTLGRSRRVPLESLRQWISDLENGISRERENPRSSR
jgi:excisionase family DNA binding protein